MTNSIAKDSQTPTLTVSHIKKTSTVEVYKNDVQCWFLGNEKKYLESVVNLSVLSSSQFGVLIRIRNIFDNTNYLLIQYIAGNVKVTALDKIKTKYFNATGTLEGKKCSEIYIVGGFIDVIPDINAVNSYKITLTDKGHEVTLLKPTNTSSGDLKFFKDKVILSNFRHYDSALEEWVSSNYSIEYDENMKIIEAVYID